MPRILLVVTLITLCAVAAITAAAEPSFQLAVEVNAADSVRR